MHGLGRQAQGRPVGPSAQARQPPDRQALQVGRSRLTSTAVTLAAAGSSLYWQQQAVCMHACMHVLPSTLQREGSRRPGEEGGGGPGTSLLPTNQGLQHGRARQGRGRAQHAWHVTYLQGRIHSSRQARLVGCACCDGVGHGQGRKAGMRQVRQVAAHLHVCVFVCSCG